MKAREINCDILRIIALIFVISVHSLSCIGFYNQINEGPTMLFLNTCRCLFMSCVPIFIVLSGYLMSKKELNKKYLSKITRIITTYIICSIVCYILIPLVKNSDIRGLSIKECITSILSFKAAPYSWYVNMYFGLFLIIPFLNVLWNNLKKKQKQYLILILFIIGILPNSINIFNFDNLTWWLSPSSSRAYQQLIPNYWGGITYIIFYYFIGCYLKEYKLNISRRKNVFLLILSLGLFGLFNYYRNYNALFEWASYVDYSSIEVIVVTILLVNLILNIKLNLKNKRGIKAISKISYLTFGAYLLSAIFDNWFYPILITNTTTLLSRVPYLLLIIPAVFICSIAFSYLVELLITISKKIIMQLKTKINVKKVNV